MTASYRLLHNGSMTVSHSQNQVIPTDPLAVTTRGSAIENTHTGWWIVVDRVGDQVQGSPNACHVSVFLRSTTKPFQAKPIVDAGLDHELPAHLLALACASHTGTTDHQAGVQGLLTHAGCSVDDLQCGIHPPIDPETRKHLKANRQTPTVLHHNCSGKHAGMLLVCRHNGWPLDTYCDIHHPLQRTILKNISKALHLESIPDSAMGVDGCGTPVLSLSMRLAAALYVRLLLDSAYRPIVTAMREHPTWMGGAGRIDTEVIRASGGHLLAKVGADGVIAIANRREQQALFLKIANGEEHVRNRLVPHLLMSLGWLTPEDHQNTVLASLMETSITNGHGDIVGQWHPCLRAMPAH